MSELATPSGTERFKERAVSDGIVEDHFRSVDGLRLTSLGMGTYLGEPDEATDRLVSDAVLSSLTSGSVNVVDTAINYRHQRAERSVGDGIEAAKKRGIERAEFFLATKGGYLTHDGERDMDLRRYVQVEFLDPGIIEREDIVGGVHCMTPEFLEAQLNASLSNLGVDAVDLLYLHNSAEAQIPHVGRETYLHRLREAFSLYEKQRRAEKIGYYGLATWSCLRQDPAEETHLNLEDVVKVAREVGGKGHGFGFVQLPLNLAMPEALVEKNQKVGDRSMTTLQAARELGIEVFTSAPLLQARLLTSDELPSFGEIGSKALKCLQFARSSPGVLAPLVGHKQPEHVQENLELGRHPPLSSSELREVLRNMAQN